MGKINRYPAGDMSQNMAIVATAKPDNCLFKHLELVSIQDSTALLVLVLQGAVVRQQLTVFDQPVSQRSYLVSVTS